MDRREAAVTIAAAESGGDSEARDHAGDVIDGRYVVEGPIGEGGLGIVVRARHVGLEQTVAIKYLKPRAFETPALVERFEREARLACRLTSEHVVRVQDVGRAPGIGPYMVMEYLVGRDLGTVVEQGPLPVERAVDYVIQACEALAEAHALGIVHRDIKPDNLFLVERPSEPAIVKLIDFGIARLPRTKSEDGTWKRETQAHERFGTPLYVSPEQLRGPADVDHRTDLWSLGVVLFELVAGHPPFDGDGVPELFANILRGEPASLQAARPEAPPGLTEVVSRCLEKDPAARFRNVAELALALLPFASEEADRRVARIRRVVERAGFSVRPAAASTGPLEPARPPLASAGITEPHALDVPPEVVRSSRGRAALAVGAGLALLVVMALAVAHRSPKAMPAPSVSPASAMLTPAAEPDLAPDVPPAPPAAPSATPPPTSELAAPSLPGPPAPRALPTPVAPPAPRPSAGATPDRKHLFGGRK